MNRIFKVVDAFLSTVVKILGIALLVTVTLQVASRYLPFTMVWTDEVSRLLFVWFSMLAIAVAYLENKHLTLDLVYDKLPPIIQKFCTVFSDVLVLATACLISYNGFKLLKTVAIQKSPITELPMSVFYAAVPVGFTFISIFGVFRLINTIRNLRSTPEKAEDKEG